MSSSKAAGGVNKKAGTGNGHHGRQSRSNSRNKIKDTTTINETSMQNDNNSPGDSNATELSSGNDAHVTDATGGDARMGGAMRHDEEGRSETDEAAAVCVECGAAGSEAGENDEAGLVECGRCTKLYCERCSQLTKARFEDYTHQSAQPWFCHLCLDKALQVVKQDAEIEKQCKKYLSNARNEITQEIKNANIELERKFNLKFTEIEKSRSKQAQEIQDLKKKIANSESQVKEKAKEAVAEKLSEERNESDRKLNESTELCIKEIAEREKRKLNLMVFNFPESEKETGLARKADDLERCRKLLADISAVVPVASVTRLQAAEPTDNPMPMRIKLTKPEDIGTVLRSASNLKDLDAYAAVSISRDMTPKEQAERRALVAEMKKRQREATTANERTTYLIRRGNLVKGRNHLAHQQQDRELADEMPQLERFM